MSTTTLILCRHGESEGNRERRFGGHGSTPLTDYGREQARAAADRLARSGADVLYSSDLRRAQETAAFAASALGLTVRTTPALRERSVGIFTGMRFEEARERYPTQFQALLQREPDSCPPEGESYTQCTERVSRFLDEVLREHAGKRIVLVSHQLALYLLLLHIMGLSIGPGGPSLYIRIDNCALHELEHYENGVWQILTLNDRAHVPPVE